MKPIPTHHSLAAAFVTLLALSGGLKHSGKNLYTRVWVSGSPVFIERRVEMDDAGTGSFRHAWSDADETAFTALVNTDLGTGARTLQEALKRAFRQMDNVFTAYRVALDFDFQAGTSESAFPRAEVGRPVLPDLLTSYLEATGSTTDKQRFRRPVLVEWAEDGAAFGKIADYSTGMTIDANGTIRFPGLRESGTTYKAILNGTTPETVTITRRKLRLSLAIPCDHRMEDVAGITIDGGGANEIEAIVGLQGSEDRLELGAGVRTYYANARDAYGFELRQDSWPKPESIVGTPNPFDNKASALSNLRGDFIELSEHVNRRGLDFCELEKNGAFQIARLSLNILPGQAINDVGGFPVRAVVQRTILISNPDGSGNNNSSQLTQLETT